MAANNQASKDSSLPQGRFTRQAGEEIEVTRPAGMYYPIGVTVRWVTPGEGREALNEMLAGILVLELDHLARAAAAGETFRIDPLKELGDREGWILNSRLKKDPPKYSLIKDDTGQEHQGPRLDLLLALEVMVRIAIKPFEDQTEIPSWVTRARKVYPQVLKALDGQPLFHTAR